MGDLIVARCHGCEQEQVKWHHQCPHGIECRLVKREVLGQTFFVLECSDCQAGRWVREIERYEAATNVEVK